MMQEEPATRGEIYVVDDDPMVRDMLSIVLSRAGFRVVCFADGPSLIAAAAARIPACILIDLNNPGKSGIDVLKEFHANSYPSPILMISGEGDIATAVCAMKHGAYDFIEKPFRGADVIARLNAAIDSHAGNRPARQGLPARFPGSDRLTPREREILTQCMRGASSKEMSRALAISPRTVDDHRANIMRKLGVKSTVEMVRVVLAASAA
jgi:FixJ family two-component response regulator